MNDEELVAELKNVLRLFKGDGIGHIYAVIADAANRLEELTKDFPTQEFLIDSQTKM